MQAAESITSRGCDGLVLHSGSYSTQNSTQPIGALAVSPSEMNSGRSSALLTVGVASIASPIRLAAAPRARIALAPELMTPLPSCWGHVSHKAFAGG
jgi:hypothetical protein